MSAISKALTRAKDERNWSKMTKAEKEKGFKSTGSYREEGSLSKMGGSTQDVMTDYVRHTAKNKFLKRTNK